MTIDGDSSMAKFAEEKANFHGRKASKGEDNDLVSYSFIHNVSQVNIFQGLRDEEIFLNKVFNSLVFFADGYFNWIPQRSSFKFFYFIGHGRWKKESISVEGKSINYFVYFFFKVQRQKLICFVHHKVPRVFEMICLRILHVVYYLSWRSNNDMRIRRYWFYFIL